MRSALAALTLAGLTQSAEAVPRTPETCGLYAYRAVVTRVIDGDTVVADIDLGFHTWRHGEHLRLIGIDAPEVRGEERERGKVSGRALTALLEGKRVIVCTEKDEQGKYGRYLAWIFLDPPPNDVRESVNAWLVREGLAEALDGYREAFPTEEAAEGRLPIPPKRPARTSS